MHCMEKTEKKKTRKSAFGSLFSKKKKYFFFNYFFLNYFILTSFYFYFI